VHEAATRAPGEDRPGSCGWRVWGAPRCRRASKDRGGGRGQRCRGRGCGAVEGILAALQLERAADAVLYENSSNVVFTLDFVEGARIRKRASVRRLSWAGVVGGREISRPRALPFGIHRRDAKRQKSEQGAVVEWRWHDRGCRCGELECAVVRRSVGERRPRCPHYPSHINRGDQCRWLAASVT
jgi:hypothetical protein